MLGAALLTAGCAAGDRAGLRSAKPLRGSVDLNRLAPLNPAWGQVRAIDAALARLHGVPNAPSAAAGAALLPAITVEAPAVPVPPLTRRQARLGVIVHEQVERFRRRRGAARRLEVERRRRFWEQQARLSYEAAMRGIQAAYAARVAEANRTEAARETNLRLQETALQGQVSAWAKSAAPAPLLAAARSRLAAVRAELAQRDQTRLRAVQAAQDARNAASDEAAQARTASVLDQTARTEARLLADDERLTQLERNRLQAVAASLPPPRHGAPSVRPAGTLAAIALPLPGPKDGSEDGSGKGPQAAWAAGDAQASARLQAQRVRWIALIRDDTRVAAADAARARRWTVTFAAAPPPGAGRDVTGAMAAALQAGVWKTLTTRL